MKIIMPQFGETVSESTISCWHKKVGDQVSKEELLFEVETDKTVMEVPSPVDGILMDIFVEEGETVDVGADLALIHNGQEGEPEAPKEEIQMTANELTSETGEKQKGGNTKLSPAVRKLLKENDINPAEITGTGKDGRIKPEDIHAYLDKGNKPVTKQKPGDVVIALNARRKLTAEHMVRSKSVSPHVLQAVEVDFLSVEAMRKSHGQTWAKDEGFSLTYLPFVAYAVCQAIHDFSLYQCQHRR